MKVKTLIKKLSELPENADIYRRVVFHPANIKIKESNILMCQHKKFPKFWETEEANNGRKPSQNVKILKKRKCYLI